ncbi:MAG TPA: hypothetical protein VF157_00595 [Chloroflexota bacterium]
MVIKQRHSILDGFLLRHVFPYLHGSRLWPLMHLAAIWHRAL